MSPDASPDPSSAEKRLYELWAELYDLSAAQSLLEWDEETTMPASAQASRGEVLATIAGMKHRLLTAPELVQALADCAAEAAPGSLLEAQVRAARRAVDRAIKVPERLQRELAAGRSAAFAAWQEAKAAADFSLFAAALGRLLDLRREEASALVDGDAPGTADGDALYDVLLDRYEPGTKSAELRPLFARLEEELAPLVRAVAESGVVVDESPARGHFPAAGQVELGRRAAAAVGFDFTAGRLDAAPHPFCIDVHHGDVRITYRLAENDLRSGLYGILHEAGHGLYEQGLPGSTGPAEWHRTPIDESVSLGLHESQSLLWENHVGRSRGFLRWLLPHVRELFPEASEVDVDALWPTLHTVAPSLIRVDADQATYNLHVAVRFELELALFHGRLEVADLPAAWNELTERTLGLRPANDAEGVLQDIHWAHGSFGYFPTYTLGTMASAQLYAAARRDLGELEEAFAEGDFSPLLGWLRDRLHRHGRRYDTRELMVRATGRPLDAEDLLAHLRRHAEEVYRI